jgi:hypothetical protein
MQFVASQKPAVCSERLFILLCAWFINSQLALYVDNTAVLDGRVPYLSLHMHRDISVPYIKGLTKIILCILWRTGGFYSRWIFITTQKLNKLQLNPISNSPSTVRRYLSVHFFNSSFTFSLAQRTLRDFQHETRSNNSHYFCSLSPLEQYFSA